MKRLRDRADPLSPLEANAVDLLRSTQRYQPALGAKQRVRARLLVSRSVAPAQIFRPAVVVAFVCLAAGASAAIGGTWLVRQHLRDTHTPHAASEVTATALVLHAPSMKGGAPSAPSAEAKLTLSDENPTSAPITSGIEGNDRTVGSSTKAPSRPVEQVKLVFDSMRALRRDGHPDRAARLLDEYLRRYPNGALAEEALALSIEAAVQRGDSRARELADRYLARYPSGQFQKAAERARARFSP